MAQVILQLDGITKQFNQATSPAVANVSLTLAQGELFGLLGPSGCGKTTLLRLIAGFERPQTGTIAIAQRTVATNTVWIPPEQRSLGMVFQDYALFPHLTVAQNIAFGLHTSERQQRDRVISLLELVGLTGLEKRYPHELSGGQQQRVALARALAPQPALILLDEPLSNLDVQVRLRLREELREILKATGISGVFVTHDQEEALAIGDRVAVMHQGKLEQIGTPEEIYTHPHTRFVAEFVTRANFLPAQRQGHLWKTEIGSFAVRNAAITRSAEVMIREEDLILHPADNASTIIKTRRFLGREYRYCLQTASGKKLHARTSAAVVLSVGTPVKLAVAEQAIKLFPHDVLSSNELSLIEQSHIN